MSFTGTVIYAKKGLVAPEALIRMSLAKNPSVVTASCIQDGKFVVEAVEKPTLEDIMTAQDMMKDYDAVLHMNSYPENFPEDSAQPFQLMMDGEEPQGLLFLDGDFSNYHEAKSAHSPDFFAYMKYFRPKIEKWFKRGGLSGVKEELMDTDTKFDIQNAFLARGNAVIFLASGELYLVQKKNEDYKEYPWGYATNSYGYKEEPKASVPAVSGKLNDPKRRLFTVRRASDTAPAPDVKTQEGTPAGDASKSIKAAADEKPAVKEEKKPSGSEGTSNATPLEDMTEIEWKPNIPLGSTRDQKKAIYNSCPFIAEWRKKMGGDKFLPDSYKNGAPVKMMVKKTDLGKYLAMDGVTSATAIGAQLAKAQQNKASAPVKAKDLTNHHIPTVKAEDSSKHAERGYKVFDTKAKPAEVQQTMAKHADEPVKNEAINGWFKEALNNPKFIDVSSQEVIDPRKIQGMENHIRPALADAGLGMEDMFRLSRPGLLALNREHFEWVTDAFLEVLNEHRKLLIQTGQMKTITPTDHVQAPDGDAKTMTSTPSSKKKAGPVLKRAAA